MAAITDLTFEQVNTIASADPNIGTNIFTLTGDVISLNVKALTGDPFTNLTNTGVVEMMYKLNKIMAETQVLANEDANTPQDELTSFPSSTFTLPTAEGIVAVSYITNYTIPLDINNTIGTN